MFDLPEEGFEEKVPQWGESMDIKAIQKLMMDRITVPKPTAIFLFSILPHPVPSKSCIITLYCTRINKWHSPYRLRACREVKLRTYCTIIGIFVIFLVLFLLRVVSSTLIPLNCIRARSVLPPHSSRQVRQVSGGGRVGWGGMSREAGKRDASTEIYINTNKPNSYRYRSSSHPNVQ